MFTILKYCVYNIRSTTSTYINSQSLTELKIPQTDTTILYTVVHTRQEASVVYHAFIILLSLITKTHHLVL